MFKPIHTKSDYEAALAEVSTLVDADPSKGSADGDRLEILVTLVQAYERELVDMSLPAPVKPLLRVDPLPKILAEISREFEMVLVAQGLPTKRDVTKRNLFYRVVTFNDKVATARTRKRNMARLVADLQTQVELANSQGRFKANQAVRRTKKLLRTAPIEAKQAA